MPVTFREEYELCRNQVEEALQQCFSEPCLQQALLEAMRYSLLAGGKRIRPVLLLKFCEAFGGYAEEAMGAACGIEMLHTYSLIHDDLPCMDDDELRRGKPTCHIVYGETNAVLAGDALQAAAFASVLSCSASHERRAAMALTLAEAAGEQGMCGGQYLDTCIQDSKKDLVLLQHIHRRKTGALLRAACVMGAQCAGAGSDGIVAASEYAENLGMAFQIRDDILDEVSTAEELGKPIGSDALAGKVTYASLLGIEECERLVDRYTRQAKSAVAGLHPYPVFLLDLADALAGRKK